MGSATTEAAATGAGVSRFCCELGGVVPAASAAGNWATPWYPALALRRARGWIVERAFARIRRGLVSIALGCGRGPRCDLCGSALPIAPLRSEHHLINLARPAPFSEFDAARGFLGEPFLDGEGESRFAALADLRGEWGTRRGGEELFAALAAGDEGWGELAQEVGVDERDADFQ